MAAAVDPGVFAHPYTYLSVAAFVAVAGSVALLVVRAGGSPARWLAAQFAAGAAWIALNVVHFGAGTEAAMLFGQYAKSTAIWVMTVCWLGFAFAYTHQSGRLTRTRWLLVLAPSVFFLSVTWGDPFVHALWSSHQPVASGPVTVLVGTETPLRVGEYVLQTGYAAVGGWVLYRGVGPRRIHRRQAAFLVAATVLVAAGAWFTVTDLYPYSAVSVAPVFVGFATPLLMYAFLEHELLELAPIARDQVFETLDSPVVVVDDRYRVVDWNPEATDVVGIGEDDAGQRIEAVFPEYARQVGLPEFEDERKRRTPTDGGTRADMELRVDGEPRTYEVGVAPVVVRGHTAGLAIRCTDVTHRVERADRLRDRNERLDRFASMVSHDLRNPLAIAEGYAEQLANDPDLGDDRRVREVNDALEEMDDLVDSILAMARGGDVEETEVVDLATVVDRAWESADELSGGTATLENDLQTFPLEAAPDQLRRILENLFRNSVEHGSRNGEDAPAEVTVRVFETEGGFAVADDGPGIPLDVRDSVFEYGTTTDADSTGIGLAAVETIVDGHGWSIEVSESEEGGARFDVSIPDREA